MNILYLEGNLNIQDTSQITITLESLIALFVFLYVDSPKATSIVICKSSSSKTTDDILINIKNFQFEFLESINGTCKLPYYYESLNKITRSGLCSVCRAIVKSSEGHHHLLGFKNACLIAPAEISTWTKFCELDLLDAISTVKKAIHISTETVDIPLEIVRFECHLKQPVRIHNIGKVKQQLSSTSELLHIYAEAHEITLADVILYPQIYLLFIKFLNDDITCMKQNIPNVVKWFHNMNNSSVNRGSTIIKKLLMNFSSNTVTKFTFAPDICTVESLYKRSIKRYKPKNKMFTNQSVVEEVLKKMLCVKRHICKVENLNKDKVDQFDKWCQIPYEALPDRSLPKERLNRKKFQLANMIIECLEIAKNGDIIVDFCSGSGYLAILLAILLPNCTIYILENKDLSLMRAKNRVDLLDLKNVKFFQCNIDYFIDNFDIGVSLHACGSATDIVIKKSIEKRANFICSPCCYGGISPMPHLHYPQSKVFQKIINYDSFKYISHCADQTHDINKMDNINVKKCMQGELCMDLVDTDRKLLAEENGYDVKLTTMYPSDCSPKNHLLVGVYLDSSN